MAKVARTWGDYEEYPKGNQVWKSSKASSNGRQSWSEHGGGHRDGNTDWSKDWSKQRGGAWHAGRSNSYSEKEKWNRRSTWAQGEHSSDKSKRDSNWSFERKDESEEGNSTNVCGEAKMRLVRSRQKLEDGQAQALVQVLKRKRDECLTLDESGLSPELLADVNTVLEQDCWDGTPSGRDWLRDWIDNGTEWAKTLEDCRVPEGNDYYCPACWKACDSDREMQKHKYSPQHRKRQKTWTWRYGVSPEDFVPVESPEGRGASPSPDTRAKASHEGASKVAGDLLRRAVRISSTEIAAAKRRLLEYRNSLSNDERQEIIRRIGLPRCNDVKSLPELQAHFAPEIAEDLKIASTEKTKAEGSENLEWICREPTFSWLSGFYWHPEGTSLEQHGEPHWPHFCHLCEVDAGSEDAYRQHCISRRHAENSVRWAEQMGNTEYPTHCGRCPDAAAASSSSSSTGWKDKSSWKTHQDCEFDLEHRRDTANPDSIVKPEVCPPYGFQEVYSGDQGSVLNVSYTSVSAKIDKHAYHVRLSSTLPIGPKDRPNWQQGRKPEKRWYVDFFWCLYDKTWKTLAIPMKDASPGEPVQFRIAVKWSDDAKAKWEELEETLDVQVPRPGEIAVLHADLEQFSFPVWVDIKPIMDFIGRGQVEAAGGVSELQGTEIPIQFATEDVIISFLLWVPEAEEPAPLLLFFHGDMPRGIAQCPMPGLADFAPVYGPAHHVVDDKKKSHPVRDFVVITPCCSEEVWWLRYPATHDATGYAMSVERCLRGIINLTYDLGICRRENGACFAGQSMGAYMALEMARAMPEGTKAVFAGAPCFDACRLDHLAERLVNVPLWLLIGRNDTMCSYEEVASLALKMRDLDCKCVRLSSVGIKGHSEVGKKLEKRMLFEWLQDPLA